MTRPMIQARWPSRGVDWGVPREPMLSLAIGGFLSACLLKVTYGHGLHFYMLSCLPQQCFLLSSAFFLLVQLFLFVRIYTAKTDIDPQFGTSFLGWQPCPLCYFQCLFFFSLIPLPHSRAQNKLKFIPSLTCSSEMTTVVTCNPLLSCLVHYWKIKSWSRPTVRCVMGITASFSVPE